VAAMRIEGGVRADRGGVAAGRDLVAQLVATGDRNTFFIGGYQRLEEAYIDPWSVFERVRLDRFVGRAWLEEDVDRFLQENDRGYFILEAKAGLGKSAFLAHLVQERGWISHFVELAPGEAGVVPARKNLAAQVMRAYELAEEGEEPVLPDEAASRPDFLPNLLRQAAEKRKDGEKIVLVADGLDEAGTRPGENVLGLPRVLPAGVFLLVSKRPVPVALTVERPRRVFTLDAGSKANLGDARAYLEGATAWDGVACALRESRRPEGGGYSAEEFVEALVAKSGGVWVYLHFVLAGIEEDHGPEVRDHPPLDLDALPQGLWAYYADFWRRWKEEHGEEWHRLHRPLLATLAAVREEVSLERLRALAGIDAVPELPERWRPFLAVQKGEQRSYRLYHGSLEDFLHGRVEPGELGEDEEDFADELARATKEVHDHIAERYMEAWGGLETGLPGLRDEGTRDLDGRYGLRCVAFHLVAAGREEDLHRLLRLEWQEDSAATNAWFAARDVVADLSGYLGDVATGWQAAEEASRRELERGEQAASIGLELRYALLTASVGSLAGGLPVALLAALVEKGMWTVERAHGYAHQVRDPAHRAAALGSLAPRLPDRERTRALADALAAVRAIGSERQPSEAVSAAEWIAQSRANALAALAPQLPEDLLPEALAVAQTIRNDLNRSQALAALVPQLPDDLLGEALATAGAIWYQRSRSQALAALAPRLPDDLLPEALAAARAIEDEQSRCEALAALAPRLAEDERAEVLAEALAAAQAIRHDGRSAVLAALAPRLPESERAAVLAEAREAAWAIAGGLRPRAIAALTPQLPDDHLPAALIAARALGNQEGRSWVLAALAARLPEAGRAKVLAEALAAARAIWSESSRSTTLAALAPQLPEGERAAVLAEALAAARAIANEKERFWALAELAPQLPESEQGDMLAEALALARAIRDEEWRSRALAALAPQLPQHLLAKALAAARAIGDEGERSWALIELFAQLPEGERATVVSDALAAARAIGDEPSRDQALAALASQLPDDLLAEALAAARAVGLEPWRSWALAEIAPRLPKDERSEVLAEALAAARAIGDEKERSWALTSLAAQVQEGERVTVLADALAAARAVRYDPPRSEALAALAPQLADDLLPEALAAAQAIEDEPSRSQALAALAPRLPGGLIPEALSAAQAIKAVDARSQALAALAPWLPDHERPAVLAEALAAWAIGAKYTAYQNTLAALAPQLPDDLLAEALAVARAIEEEESRCEALVTLARHLPDHLLAEALAVARTIAYERWRARALTALAPRLPESERAPVLADAVTSARAIGDERLRSEALASLAPLLPENERPKVLADAFASARAIGDERSRSEALASLAPLRSERERAEVLGEALAAARTTEYARVRPGLLRKVAQQVSSIADLDWEAFGQETLWMLASRKRSELVSDIRALSPLVSSVGGSAAVKEAGRAVQDVGRWFP
jgi:hypothetical protein